MTKKTDKLDAPEPMNEHGLASGGKGGSLEWAASRTPDARRSGGGGGAGCVRIEKQAGGVGKGKKKSTTESACEEVRWGCGRSFWGGLAQGCMRRRVGAKAPVANLLREYDVIYGGHYTEGQTNGGY